jgi:hypothetical protein
MEQLEGRDGAAVAVDGTGGCAERTAPVEMESWLELDERGQFTTVWPHLW